MDKPNVEFCTTATKNLVKDFRAMSRTTSGIANDANELLTIINGAISFDSTGEVRLTPEGARI